MIGNQLLCIIATKKLRPSMVLAQHFQTIFLLDVLALVGPVLDV